MARRVKTVPATIFQLRLANQAKAAMSRRMTGHGVRVMKRSDQIRKCCSGSKTDSMPSP